MRYSIADQELIFDRNVTLFYDGIMEITFQLKLDFAHFVNQLSAFKTFMSCKLGITSALVFSAKVTIRMGI